MREHVVVPCGRGGEPGGADLAAVRLLARVGAAVVDQRRLLRETAVAELTLVWPLSYSHSIKQVIKIKFRVPFIR